MIPDVSPAPSLPPRPNLGPEPWPEPPAGSREWVAWAVAVAVVLVVVMVWRWSRRRRRPIQGRIPVAGGPGAVSEEPAPERVVRLSAEVRRALADRLGSPLPAMTTEEVLARMAAEPAFSKDGLEPLRSLLREADRVKFAGRVESEDAREHAEAWARDALAALQ